MKKLLFWAVLLMTGFAFYSCDERFDNPATETPNPSDPASTWTYEVSVRFSWFTSYYGGEDPLKFEAPNTLYVFNKSLDLLGEITCDEEIDQDNYSADFYKFKGTLKGAIGDTLVIGTIGDKKWFAEKQDGTIETIYKNGILQSAKAPIIVANESNGKIGTQRVELQNHTAIVGFRMYRYATGKETGVTISSDKLMMPKAEDINITFAEGIDPSERFWVALPLLEGSSANYTFKTTSEKGVDLFGTLTNRWFYPSNIYTTSVEMMPKEIDLAEYKELFSTSSINVRNDGTTLTQSGDEPIEMSVSINAKDVTIKGLNLKNSNLYVNVPSRSTKNSLNIEGENVFDNENYYAGMWISNPTIFKGNGSLSINGDYFGIYIYDWNQFNVDDETYLTLPGSLTIENGVTVKAYGKWSSGIYIDKRSGTYSYKENGEWKEGEWTDLYNNFLEVNGNLEVESEYTGIYKYGKITVGETGTLKVTSNNAGYKIYDGNITEGDDYEAKLETLVADKSKFSDEISEDKKVRTIKKK
jgi:hypothetical protein